MVDKPHLELPIAECGEPLVGLPHDFAVVDPHPYLALGAPYGDKSPFFLRSGVLDRLLQAQNALQQHYPHLSLQIFDAYRPLAVQQFMVDYTFRDLADRFAQEQGLDPLTLSAEQTHHLWQQVHQFWADPIADPHRPPPHSTGAALDVTLLDVTQQQPLDMGSPIDECSPRSYPDHFAPATHPPDRPREPSHNSFHHHRLILRTAMQTAGFQNHPREWWHFSHGDQLWAWLERQQGNSGAIARYGRWSLLEQDGDGARREQCAVAVNSGA